jgi:molybdopterin-binding protein
MVTHDIREAFAASDRVGFMSGGNMVQCAPPVEIVEHPASAEIAKMVGFDNVYRGVVAGRHGGLATVRLESGGDIVTVTEITDGSRVLVVIKPEDVLIMLGKPSQTSARNVFSGKVDSVVPKGFMATVAVDCGFSLAAAISVESLSELGLVRGVDVHILVKATAIQLVQY